MPEKSRPGISQSTFPLLHYSPSRKLAVPTSSPGTTLARDMKVHRLSRPVLGLCAALTVSGAGAVGLGVWNSQRVGRTEALLGLTVGLPSGEIRRPSHGKPPLPGKFSDRVAGPLGRLESALREHSWPKDEPVQRVCRELIDGKRSLAELPSACNSAVRNLGPMAREVLQATRAETGGAAEAFQLEGFVDKHWVAFTTATKVVALDAVIRSAEGDVREAIGECLDLVALSREARLSGYLVGIMKGAAYVGLSEGPCLAALNKARGNERQGAAKALTLLRDSMPPLSNVLQSEAAWFALANCGQFLTADEARSASPAAQVILKNYRLSWNPGLWNRTVELFGRGPLCQFTARHYRRVIEATGLPASERDAALEALDEPAGWPRWVGMQPSGVSKFIRRDEEARRVLDRLVDESNADPEAIWNP